MKKPNIICTGMLDTKGPEIQYLADVVRKNGGNPVFMDLSLGHEVDWADITLTEVLAAVGIKKEEVFSAARSDAFPIVGKAGAKKLQNFIYREKLMVSSLGLVRWGPAP